MLKAKAITVVLFLLFSVINSTSVDGRSRKRSPPPPPSSPPPPPPAAPVFELFVLTLTWPRSYCEVTLGCPKGNILKFPKFTIHGLWPSNYTGGQPENCPSGQQMLNWAQPMMNTLRTPMENTWSDLKESNTRLYIFFWQEQWNKHGSCSTMEPYDYFHQALELYANKDLLPILQSDKKTRPGVNPIKFQDVLNAISTGIGKRPQIICETKDNKSYIKEVRLCLDKSKVIGKSMVDVYVNCRSVNQCPKTVYLMY